MTQNAKIAIYILVCPQIQRSKLPKQGMFWTQMPMLHFSWLQSVCRKLRTIYMHTSMTLYIDTVPSLPPQLTTNKLLYLFTPRTVSFRSINN